MRNITAAAHTWNGVTVLQTMSGIVVQAAKPNPDLETQIAAVYEQYQNGKISQKEAYAKIDQLVSDAGASSNSEAHK